METTTSPRLNTKGAMLKYCIQNIAAQAAFCPATMMVAFMLARGISNSAAGVAMALGNLLALVIQPVIASIADSKTGPTIARMSFLASIAMVVAFLGGWVIPNHILIMACVAAMLMLFMNLLGLINSISVYYQNRGASINYGVARGLGSASYAGVAAVIGFLADNFGADVYVLLGAGLSALIALTMLLLPTPKNVPALVEAAVDDVANDETYVQFLKKHWKFLLLIVGSALGFVMESSVGTYTLPIVQSVGGGEAEMGLAMALQAILELPGMWGYNWLETKFKTSSLLIFSIAMYAVKGFMFCIASSIPMIYVAYAFQAVSFAIFTPAGISYANKFFGEGDKNKAIGLFSLIGSIAGIIAAPVSGWAIDGFGVHMMLVIVTVMAGVGVVFSFLGLEREKAQA